MEEWAIDKILDVNIKAAIVLASLVKPHLPKVSHHASMLSHLVCSQRLDFAEMGQEAKRQGMQRVKVSECEMGNYVPLVKVYVHACTCGRKPFRCVCLIMPSFKYKTKYWGL